MSRNIETMRTHAARHLSGHRIGNAYKVKFSCALWNRLLRQHNEYAALRRVYLPEVTHAK